MRIGSKVGQSKRPRGGFEKKPEAKRQKPASGRQAVAPKKISGARANSNSRLPLAGMRKKLPGMQEDSVDLASEAAQPLLTRMTLGGPRPEFELPRLTGSSHRKDKHVAFQFGRGSRGGKGQKTMPAATAVDVDTAEGTDRVVLGPETEPASELRTALRSPVELTESGRLRIRDLAPSAGLEDGTDVVPRLPHALFDLRVEKAFLQYVRQQPGGAADAEFWRAGRNLCVALESGPVDWHAAGLPTQLEQFLDEQFVPGDEKTPEGRKRMRDQLMKRLRSMGDRLSAGAWSDSD